MNILEYTGPEPIQHYVHGRSGISHIIIYACGCWMCCDVPRMPFFCPTCQRQIAGIHENTQAIFEGLCANEIAIAVQKLKKQNKQKKTRK